ncbi:PREDICTED: cytochrome P450 4c3-like [Papilio polytes]|uniref:cytochrome P450 4c3-like n=1 Tax=Papilio polytes TaxID=76194 RepID=UPI0006768616|nr:PREDICTED: cytochrome P450 4c3-like [Papilio polytes]
MFTYLLTLILILILIHVYFRYNREGRLMAQIPGLKGLPFFGNTFDVLMSLEELFQNLRKINKEYGDVNKLQFFNINAINIYNPDDIEIILSSNSFIGKKLPYTLLAPWLSEGLVMSNGEKWRQRRKLLANAFHFNILKNFVQTFVHESETFVNQLEDEKCKEKTHMQPLISWALQKVMCATAFGITIHDGLNSVTDKYFDSVLSFCDTATYRITRLLLHIDLIFNLTKIGKQQKHDVQNLHDLTHRIISEKKDYLRENNEIKNNDCEIVGKKTRLALLDLLLKKEQEGEIDYDGIREEVDTFMFGGHDTCAIAHSFLMMSIANEPRVQELIYEEQQRIFGDSRRTCTIEDLSEMKYLECCIKESLRLYPSAPVIVRHITQDVILSGRTVPKNSYIGIHIYDLHRRPDVYPEPEKFIPERFLPENSINRHPYAYIPFSAGPRNCIGQKFAMLEMKTFMSALMRRFRLEPVTKPEELTYKLDILLRSTEPIYVRLCSRK